MTDAREALQRLRDGNERFVARLRDGGPPQAGVGELLQQQNPFAIVLGCSDSRVPPEIVFDQSIGDLFVARVAGNVATSTQIGSIEFAASQFDVSLIVVLGHTDCGAVNATIEEMQRPDKSLTPHLRAIVDRIRPSVEPLIHAAFGNDTDDLAGEAVRANILRSADRLRRKSALLAKLSSESRLRIVGAEYSLQSGQVHFYDETTAS